MGRHTKDLPVGENPETVAFAADLRKIRVKAGNPTLAEMARISGVSVASLSKASGGYELPSWRVAEAFLAACGNDSAAWRGRWEKARRAARPGAASIGDEPPESLHLDAERRRRASWARTWERWERIGMIVPPHRAETNMDLRLALDSLRNFRSLSLRQLALLMPYSHSTLAAVLSGARPVKITFLRQYLMACGVKSLAEHMAWHELFATANPQLAMESERQLRYLRDHGSTYQQRRLPASKEIARIKVYSMRKRSERLRSWITEIPLRQRRSMYRRLDAARRVTIDELGLFERGEYPLTLKKLNAVIDEAKNLGYQDIDPMVED